MGIHIKDFFEGMVMTFYRMVGLISIPAGIYILCVLHISPDIWLGIIGFLMAMFLIVVGVVITWLFGWYDRILDEDSKRLKELLREDKHGDL